MITLRLANLDDFDFYYSIKCEDSSVFWGGFIEPPDKENLWNFFSRVIAGQKEEGSRKIYIIEDDDVSVGNFDLIPYPDKKDVFRTSVGIKEQYRGRGYAGKAIPILLENAKNLGFKQHLGRIREDNAASLKTFLSNGYVLTGEYEYDYIAKLDKEVKMLYLKKEL